MNYVTEDKQVAFSNYSDAQDSTKIIEANNFAKLILDEICSSITPGMKESEVVNQINIIYKKYNVDRIWHQPLVRFGSNTLLTFKDKATEDKILQENDIAFVDIGIVKNGIEGDVGKTLAFGNKLEYQNIVSATESLFNLARDYWLAQDPTGEALYQYISELTVSKGYDFNLASAGHLIGSFSHAAAKWNKGLSQYPSKLLPSRWILEIQIKDPVLNVGGFYEELLV